MKATEGSTVIGKAVIIRGDLSGSEDLYMDGDIEGTITLLENRLTIGPNARVHADIHARDVVVLGHLTGNVTATGRVDLRESARVAGDIVAARLAIEETVIFKGRVELKGTIEESAQRASVASESTAAKGPLFTQSGA